MDLLVVDPEGPSAYLVDALTGNRIRALPTPEHAWVPREPVVLAASGDRYVPRELGRHAVSPVAGFHHGCWIVVDCDLYDAADLTAELEAAGRSLVTGCAAEVLAAAYREWGPTFPLRLRGGCAGVLLDAESGSLVGFRDCFGMRPLHYTKVAGCTFFASEIPTLLRLPSVRREAAPQPLFDYLAFGRTNHDTSTLFVDVKAVLPATYVQVRSSEPSLVETIAYWMPVEGRSISVSPTEAADEVYRLAERNLTAQVAGFPRAGVFLSGGIDSTALALMMRASAPDTELETFSYVGGRGAVSEEKWIDIANDAAGADGHKLRLAADDWAPDVDRVAEAQAEPMGSIAVYAEERLYRLAQEAGVEVVLVGHVPYPLLDGSPTLLGRRLGSLLRRGALIGALRHVRGTSEQRRVTGLSLLSVCRTGLIQASPAWTQRFARTRLKTMPWIDRRWTEAERVAVNEVPAEGRDVIKSAIKRDLLALVPRMLRIDDRNMASNRVNGRFPFFDRDLFEFVLSLPEGCLVPPHGPRKAFVKEAMKGVLPAEIMARNDKVGFSVPVQAWVTELPQIAELLQSARAIPAVDGGWIDAMTEQIRRGSTLSVRQSYLVWRVADLVRWGRCFSVNF